MMFHFLKPDHMKKLFFMVSTALVLLATTACNSKGEGAAEADSSDESPAMQLLNSVPFTEEGLVSMIKTPADQPISDVEYEALWLAYSKVKIDESRLELEDNPVSSAMSTIYENHERPASVTEIQEKLLTSQYPQVRGEAMGQFASLFGVTKEDVKKLTDLLADEKDPYVLQEGVSALANELSKEDAAKFVLGQKNNENKFVRRAVAYAVANSWSKGVPGVTEAARELMADKEDKVREAVLAYVGKLGDESFVPDLVKVLNDDTQADLHDECMKSLYTLWYDYPFHESTSKAAYDAAVNYLKKKPRTEDIPAWTSVGELRTRSDRNYDAWKAKATYFNEAEYIKIMADIAADPNANWLGRTSAIDVIAKLGAKADLEKVKSAINALPEDSKRDLVLRNLEEKLNK